MRLFLLFLACACAVPLPGKAEPRPYVQAVEFPYYLYPRTLWERELVWLKTVGIDTIEFSVPWNWHEIEAGTWDFTGRTSPRRDLAGFVRLLRRLNLRAWVRPLPPVKGWVGGGYPPWAGQDRAAARRWIAELKGLLDTQTVNHGGPIAFMEGAAGFDVPGPPLPVSTVSAADPEALVRSRRALSAARGSLLWEDVEDALFPVGWEAPGGPIARHGAVSLNGDERPSVAALRIQAALLRHWGPLLGDMRTRSGRAVEPVSGKFPPGVTAEQLFSAAPHGTSAINLINQSKQPFQGAMRVWYSRAGHYLEIPSVLVPPGEALWLPVNAALAGGLCGDCSAFATTEHIIYATAELQAIEFENGILAMEFCAPVAGEVLLQLSHEPSGPLLAAGHPTKFDWDEKTFRARLPIPAGQGASHRVRIGLAIEPPESSAFFVDAHRLIIGRRNVLSTSYSSAELAERSRLRLPEGYTASPMVKSPTEIEYAVDVPADALHGDWVNLAIEADGVALGRARVQLFRPLSVRLPDAVKLDYGGHSQLMAEPPLIPMDARNGRNLDLSLRNNYAQIQTFGVEAGGDGLRFFPPKTEISMGAVMDRSAEIRVFPEKDGSELRDARIVISGAAKVELPVRFVPVPRGQTVAYSADLDGDGYLEWVLENQRARAIFSARDGGRWLEFVWKDSGRNLLPEEGAFAGSGTVEVRVADGALEFSARDWRRTVRLAGGEARLTVEQTTPLPPETLKSRKQDEIHFEVGRPTPARAVYTLAR